MTLIASDDITNEEAIAAAHAANQLQGTERYRFAWTYLMTKLTPGEFHPEGGLIIRKCVPRAGGGALLYITDMSPDAAASADELVTAHKVATVLRGGRVRTVMKG